MNFDELLAALLGRERGDPAFAAWAQNPQPAPAGVQNVQPPPVRPLPQGVGGMALPRPPGPPPERTDWTNSETPPAFPFAPPARVMTPTVHFDRFTGQRPSDFDDPVSYARAMDGPAPNLRPAPAGLLRNTEQIGGPVWRDPQTGALPNPTRGTGPVSAPAPDQADLENEAWNAAMARARATRGEWQRSAGAPSLSDPDARAERYARELDAIRDDIAARRRGPPRPQYGGGRKP